MNWKMLNRDKLTKENRYGNIKFSIDFIFDFGLLEKYIIPLGISVVRELDNSLSYKLFCLSPFFNETENMISSDDAPTYMALFHTEPFKYKKRVEFIKQED